MPATLSVTADDSVNNPTNVPATVTVNLQDLVTITLADYSAATGQLTVTANSSDLFVPPTLTLAGFAPGTLTNGVPTAFYNRGPSGLHKRQFLQRRVRLAKGHRCCGGRKPGPGSA